MQRRGPCRQDTTIIYQLGSQPVLLSMTTPLLMACRSYLRWLAEVASRIPGAFPRPDLPGELLERIAREALIAEGRSPAAALRLGRVSKAWQAALKGTPLDVHYPLLQCFCTPMHEGSVASNSPLKHTP